MRRPAGVTVIGILLFTLAGMGLGRVVAAFDSLRGRPVVAATVTLVALTGAAGWSLLRMRPGAPQIFMAWAVLALGYTAVREAAVGSIAVSALLLWLLLAGVLYGAVGLYLRRVFRHPT